MSTARELFLEGKLSEALAAQTAQVKARPADVDARGLLIEFLCLAGQLERADTQLETVLAQSPDRLAGTALLRQLVRAEQARRDFWTLGRVPEFQGEPGPRLKLGLEASIRLRERDFAGAMALLVQAEELRAPLAGQHGQQAFADLRELDDRLGGVLEVLTSTGKYYWIDFAEVELLEFEAPERPLDLLWRRARLALRSGTDGTVYVPAIYAPLDDAQDAHKLARATDWVETGPGGPVRGVGQRTWMIGDSDVPLLEVDALRLGAGGA
ncbi:MAG: SciE type virulence protein [Planctomycetes bacterium]|nr:SciE type virulence protein [Planctomycetota bacterium]